MVRRTNEEDGVKTVRNQTKSDQYRLTEHCPYRHSLVCECVLMCVLFIRKAHTNTHRQTDRQTLNDS